MQHRAVLPLRLPFYRGIRNSLCDQFSFDLSPIVIEHRKLTQGARAALADERASLSLVARFVFSFEICVSRNLRQDVCLFRAPVASGDIVRTAVPNDDGGIAAVNGNNFSLFVNPINQILKKAFERPLVPLNTSIEGSYFCLIILKITFNFKIVSDIE